MFLFFFLFHHRCCCKDAPPLKKKGSPYTFPVFHFTEVSATLHLFLGALPQHWRMLVHLFLFCFPSFSFTGLLVGVKTGIIIVTLSSLCSTEKSK
jgi:hypothetical protein